MVSMNEWDNADAFFAEAWRLHQAGYTVQPVVSGAWGDWTWTLETTGGPSPNRTGAIAPPAQASVVTGVDPAEIANALYGKIIPLSALGLARIGTAGLIFGPYFNSGLASFAVSFGFPVNPSGTRMVYEISLDSKVVWESAAGSPAGALGPGFLGEAFDCRFYSGTMTQGADPLEAAMFGGQAVAYRPQMMLWFTNLPVAPYDGKIPFVSAKIGDVTGGAVPADGLNLGDAIERVAYSPWLEYDASTFDTSGVADIVQAMILTEDQTFLNLLQVIARVYRTFDILQTDKLRISDRGSVVTPDVTLQRDHISADAGVEYSRQEETSVPRELELLTIDPDADYVFMPYKVSRQLTPVPVTSAVGRDSITLPVVIGATTRASLATFAKYEEDNARKRIALQTMLYGYALEPGDLFRLSGVANGFDQGEVFKVTSTSHGANYINEIAGEAILKCSLTFEDADPLWNYVILLLHANTDTPVTDSSALNATMLMGDNVTVDTTIKKYGGASFRFSGGAANLVITQSGYWSYYSYSPTNTGSPYTVELWARFDAVETGPRILICRNYGLVGLRLWQLYHNLGELTYSTSSTGVSPTATLTTTSADLVNGTWYHIAVDKDSTGKVRIYVDGAMKASGTPADSTFSTNTMEVGVGGADVPANTTQNPFIGNIDDVRITVRSRYGDVYGDAGFLPSGIQFPDHS